MLLIEDTHHEWTYIQQNNARLYFKGSKDTASDVMALVKKHPLTKIDEALTQHLRTATHYTGGAVETDTLIIAWVDHIRSWPLFYSLKNGQITLSNSARRLKNHSKLNTPDENALTEFAMSGFIGGQYTMIKDLLCLQPGEFLIFDKENKTLNTHRYFKYTPQQSDTRPAKDKKQALDRILNEITLEIIDKAAKRTIWIPLSAGLDSRILLCKLHQHGYKNIQTFTYGPKYNFESLHAKKIAKTLGVPWQMICPPRTKIKDYFKSPERLKFWHYADNLKAIPCMREYTAIAHLHEQKIAKPGDIFLNGQSGDYITGGHIPDLCFGNQAIDYDTFFQELIKKHHSLWQSLKTPENTEIIKDAMSTLMPENWRKESAPDQRARQSEIWEYDARQICYVANGQRIYEFFGFNWEMPLWDKRLVEFYQMLLLPEKKHQSLYKDYLQEYNYCGLFPEKEPYIWRWPVPKLWIVGLAQIIGLLAGKQKKKDFYSAMRPHGHYANQYAFFPRGLHQRNHKNARNEVALYVLLWLKENKALIHCPTLEKITETLKIPG